MIGKIDMDIILSDPILMAAAFLIIIGPILFFLSLIKFLQYEKPQEPFLILPPTEPEKGETTELAAKTEREVSPEKTEFIPPSVEKKPSDVFSDRFSKPPTAPASDQTMILPPYVAELQAQMEIVVTQLKNLNKKIFEIEKSIEALENHLDARLDPGELKEPPMNPADFAQKLLKVVEHVIVLEKEVAKLKTSQPSTSSQKEKPAPNAGSSQSGSTTKPPVMPI